MGVPRLGVKEVRRNSILTTHHAMALPAGPMTCVIKSCLCWPTLRQVAGAGSFKYDTKSHASMLMLSCFIHVHQVSTKCSDDAGLGQAEIGLAHEVQLPHLPVDLAIHEQELTGHDNAANAGVLHAPQVWN